MVSGNVAAEPAMPSSRELQTLRYESLTVWRGVACLLIVVYHSGLYRPVVSRHNLIFEVLDLFWVGVPMFFVISGYCITASADALRKNPVPVRRFFWRRFRRIFPPYWIWLGLLVASVYAVETFVAPGYFQCAKVPVHEMTKWRWLGNVSLTEMLRTHLTGEAPTKLFWGPSWTLCYEEQFYFVVGLILLFARRLLFGAATLISLAVIGGAVLISGYDVKTSGIFLNCIWLAFAAGVLAYYALNYVSPARRDWYCIPLAVGTLCLLADQRKIYYLDGKWIMALCGIAAFYIWNHCAHRWRNLFIVPLVLGLGYAFEDRASAFRGRIPDTGENCVAAFLFSFLIIALKNWDGFINRSRLLSPLRFCGEMCYSLYLVHWPVVQLIAHAFDLVGVTSPAAILFITVPTCVAVSLLIAWAFHRLVERRFWNRRI